jgi:hypothetical protein
LRIFAGFWFGEERRWGGGVGAGGWGGEGWCGEGWCDLDVVSRVFVVWLVVGGREVWWEGEVVEDGLRERVVHLSCLSMCFLFSWDYVVGWLVELGLGFVSERHVWVGLGCSYVSKSADDRILERRLRCYLDTGEREERRGEVR